ncbi:general substrate transporter [Hymenopellis radicata]|nr:general substrate transporter [Hymenopellis radicata]
MAPRSLPEWTIVDFIHRGPWWTNRGIVSLNLCLFLSLITSCVNGLDSSLVNGLQILPDWQIFFNHPEGKALGLIQSAQNIGGFIALPITPFVSDTLGRRASLFIGSLILLAGVAIQFAAPTVKLFIGARVILGFGLAFCTNSAPLLLLELAYPTQRGKITSFYNSSWYFGSIISAWAACGPGEYRPSYKGRTPPSSVLDLDGQEGKAAQILAKYHANGGDERDPLVVFELAQIRHALRMEELNNKHTSYWSLLATPGNRRRMTLIIAIAIFSQWSGNGLVSYYINLVLEGVGITSAETKAAINGGLQIFNLVVALGSASLIDWVGRRTLFIVSNSGMLVAFGCWTITEALFNELHRASAAKATIPLIFLYYFFYDIAYSPMLVAYTLEILPYKIRAKGFAVMNIAVMLTIAFNQFVNPWAIQAIGWWYYIVYCGWLIIELVFVVTFIVETKGRTLEETAAIFDGEQQEQDIAHMGGEAATMTMSRAVALEDRVPTDSDESHRWSQDKESETYHPIRPRQTPEVSFHSRDIGRAI